MNGSQRQQCSRVIFLCGFLYILANAEPRGCWTERPVDPHLLEQCGGQGIILRCNGTNRTLVPRFNKSAMAICVLDLSHNSIEKVPDEAFVNVSEVKNLYLSENNISHIQSNAFNRLNNLLYLNLTVNQLEWPGGFDKGVFKHLTNLTNLSLKNNPIKSFDGLDEELSPLKNLEGLFIDGCYKCVFGKKFVNFSRLRNISLSGRTETSCNMSHITNKTFQNVPQIYGLWMSDCHIEQIEAGAFQHLTELRILDFSYNEKIMFEGMNKALYGLKNHSHLYLLNVNHIHESYGRGTELKRKHIENLITLQNLTILHMDLNKVEVFDENIVHPVYQLPKSLRALTLSGNRLTYDIYMNYLIDVKYITHLDVSRQHLFYDPFKHRHDGPEEYQTNNFATKQLGLNNWDSSIQFVGFPRDLVNIKARSISLNFQFIPNIVIFGAEHLEQWDLSYNMILQWNGVIKGLENLKVFDLSDNKCQKVAQTFFKTMPNLEKLNISGNSLAGSPNLSDILFGNSLKLTELDISRNNLRHLPADIFKNLPSLEYLYLNHNDLEYSDVGFLFNTSTCLKTLDLSFNKLKELPNNLTNYFDEVAGKTCKGIVKINMTNNPIECTCDTLDFLSWMRDKTHVDVHFGHNDYCNMKGHERVQLNNKQVVIGVIHKLEKECKDWTWLLIICVVTATCILTVIICKVLFKYRWKLRYIYYNRNRRHFQEGFERLFENDAFISYASSMCALIKNQLVPNLEDKFNLKVWAADRDSQAAVSQAENIVHAITNSRKSILLVDRYYLKDNMCGYEMNMARMESVESKRAVIIVVLFNEVSLGDLPASIFKNFQDEKSFQFPINDTPEVLDEFWEKIFVAVRE